jgi:hypothetical protein
VAKVLNKHLPARGDRDRWVAAEGADDDEAAADGCLLETGACKDGALAVAGNVIATVEDRCIVVRVRAARAKVARNSATRMYLRNNALSFSRPKRKSNGFERLSKEFFVIWKTSRSN